MWHTAAVGPGLLRQKSHLHLASTLRGKLLARHKPPPCLALARDTRVLYSPRDEVISSVFFTTVVGVQSTVHLPQADRTTGHMSFTVATQLTMGAYVQLGDKRA